MSNLRIASEFFGGEGRSLQGLCPFLPFRAAVLKTLFLPHNLRKSAKSADKTFPRRSGAASQAEVLTRIELAYPLNWDRASERSRPVN